MSSSGKHAAFPVKRSSLPVAPTRPAGRFQSTIARLVLLPVHTYRKLISPLVPPRCKYHPTCSQYALDAVREVGVLRGLLLAAWRLARCNPWSNGGLDPIEERPFFRSARRQAASSREAAA